MKSGIVAGNKVIRIRVRTRVGIGLEVVILSFSNHTCERVVYSHMIEIPCMCACVTGGTMVRVRASDQLAHLSTTVENGCGLLGWDPTSIGNK